MIATCLVGATTVALAAPTIAGAEVDQTTPQWAELGTDAYTGNQASDVTAVYTIQNVAEGNGEMLEDNGNAMGDGAVTDVWQQVDQGSLQPTGATGNDNAEPDNGPITQANYLWEYVPENPNAGPSIADGPGELINRQSGLCLDVNASDPNYPGNGTTVDQWTCDGGANQQWSVGRRGSQYLLVSGLNNASDLGVGNGTCSPQGDGDKVYLQQSGFGLPSTSCDEWTITPASYDFATHPMTALKNEVGGGNVDNREYTCAPTDQFRQGMEVNLQDWGGALTAIGPVIVDAGDSRVQFDWTGSDAPDAVTTLAGSSFEYYQSTSTQYLDAQTMFYCDPQSGTL